MRPWVNNRAQPDISSHGSLVMNHKQRRLIRDISSQLQAIYEIADNKMNGEVFSDGKIDADEIYLRSLIAMSALRSFEDIDIAKQWRSKPD